MKWFLREIWSMLQMISKPFQNVKCMLINCHMPLFLCQKPLQGLILSWISSFPLCQSTDIIHCLSWLHFSSHRWIKTYIQLWRNDTITGLCISYNTDLWGFQNEMLKVCFTKSPVIHLDDCPFKEMLLNHPG